MTANDIRKKFLEFFKSKGHTVVTSDSLVPKDDPTVLFTTAGMQQFKRQFLGQIDGYTRATTSQKCLRTDDLDQVGVTAFHHTFFEMLGNFSFGDYFKREAIIWAWEFLTKIVKIPAERLWVSVYKDDAEAYNIWLTEVKFPAARIVKLGDKSNFWPSNAKQNGPNGPCGPCSEIFYDYGVNPHCKSDVCDPSCDCGRFSEVWNLVFTQFNRKDGGILDPLPSKNIDTGMGLERLVAVVQGKKSNYETDLFAPILASIDQVIAAGFKLGPRERHVVADHARAIVFSIADGVVPSNEGRGYVVKKLIIDVVDICLQAGIKEPNVGRLVPVVVEVMRQPYPEVVDKVPEIVAIIKKIEDSYIRTRKEKIPELEQSLKMEIPKLTGKTREERLGELYFIYRDTYGLTLSTILKTAELSGVSVVDREAALKYYDQRMEGQKERSRAASKMTGDVFADAELNLNVPKTKFLGYEQMQGFGTVMKIFVGNREVPAAHQGDAVKVILDQTPFYAESGGQIGDTGTIVGKAGSIKVSDTQKISDVFLHSGVVDKGTLKTGDSVDLTVDEERRLSIMRNHTATHLLQAALRQVLGAHIKQQGSLVAEDRLRFDFAHSQAITPEQIEAIETKVNEFVLRCDAVSKDPMPIEQAKKSGALAFFAEKYGDVVRVVSIGNYSKEFCGGTHLTFTGQIGPFKVTSEGAVAQGIRRIEAVTGRGALQFILERERKLEEVAAMLKSPVDDIVSRVDQQARRLKLMEKELEAAQFEVIKSSIDGLVASAETVRDAKLIAHTFKNVDMEVLRKVADLIRQKAASAICVLGAQGADAASLLVSVSDDLVKKNFRANELIKEIAPLIGGSGGGRPQLAQAGSKSPEKIGTAVEQGKQMIKDKLK